MVGLQDVNPSNARRDVERREDLREPKLLLSDEIHLWLYYCVLRTSVRRDTHKDCTSERQLVITYGISSSAWYPFKLLSFTETSIKKEIDALTRNMVQLAK